MSHYFELHSEQYGRVGAFTNPGAEGYVIGRTDESSDFVPDIDLTACNAREHGVSRRHLAIVSFHSAAHIIDLSSVNGTFLNGRRLPPDVPFAIAIGDELRLGTLVLRIAAGSRSS